MITSEIIHGDAKAVLQQLRLDSFDCCVTSPPYWRTKDYGVAAQLGWEETPDEFIAALCSVFDEVYRVLRNDGTLWVNLGDTYLNQRLYAIPHRFAAAMVDRGWMFRNDIVWYKPNPKPAHTRPEEYHRFVVDFEPVMFFTKTTKHYFNRSLERAVLGGYKMKRAVWRIPTAVTPCHPAPMPLRLALTAIRAGCPKAGTVLDPFCGSGTTGSACLRLDRSFVGIDLNPEYVAMAEEEIEFAKSLKISN